ncbi:MAG: protein-tyrosine-phosphatase [Acidobacteria bacterium]|nr:protein-tyrosine-phosphatase [Acidobacteriota bacterium]
MMRHGRKAIVFFWAVLLLSLPLLEAPALSAAQDTWEGVERVVAIGDVHGDYEQFVAVLRSARLIDSQEGWSGGKTHLVQTGDVLDRGPDSRKVMDLLMRLEREASKIGGEVHVLIGNHEAMNVYGDNRYVSAEEFASYTDRNYRKRLEEHYQRHQKRLRESPPPEGVQKFDEAYRTKWESENPLGYIEHREAFGPSGKYGKWIRSLNAVIKIDETLFLHGGVAPKYTSDSLRKINDRIRNELEDFTKLQGGIVMDGEGPLWYRGLAQGNEKILEPHVQTVLRNHKVERIVIGHTFTEGAVIPRFGGKVLLIDIGLARLYDTRLRLACLLIENGKPYALHRWKRLELPSDSGGDLLRYLKQAAALDLPPSSLEKRIAELEARPTAPVQK